MTMDNSPPAFPSGLGPVNPNTGYQGAATFGMSLRDHLAARAMQGLMSRTTAFSDYEVAVTAYSVADAMLKVRETQDQDQFPAGTPYRKNSVLHDHLSSVARCAKNSTVLNQPPEDTYLLQNCTAGFIGNSPVFWREGGSGYTPWIDEAKRWTKDEAEKQIRSTKGSHSWVMWSLSAVEAKAKRTVIYDDILDMVE